MILRKFATPATIFTSLIVFATGLWMYFVAKSSLIENIHGQLGIVFFLAVLLHLVVNKNPFFKVLKTKSTYITAALVLVLGSGLVLATNKEGKGVPPGAIFHKLEGARLDDLSRVFQADPAHVIASMNQDGIKVTDGSAIMQDIARSNGKLPRELLRYFFGEKPESEGRQ